MTETEVRVERNARIATTDWTQAPDAPVTENERGRWRHYRRQLRDITKQAGFPASVDWPVEPERDPVIESAGPMGGAE